MSVVSEEAKLRDLLHRLLHELPHTRSAGPEKWCAGCGAHCWLTLAGPGKEPCNPDCVLQEALKAAKKLPEEEA
jgi:hypothetical protein